MGLSTDSISVNDINIASDSYISHLIRTASNSQSSSTNSSSVSISNQSFATMTSTVFQIDEKLENGSEYYLFTQH